jgi:tetratricopeptide (TPR) repeat protein
MPGMRKGYLAVAWFVFLSTLAVYARTVTSSIPFWDSGEFIATSYTLGIPHPPGTPLYVLIGRIFSLLPLGNVHLAVNLLSSLASALGVLFTFLVTVRFMRLAQVRHAAGGQRTSADEVIAWAAGAAAAFFAAFSNTYWGSAIEAEVYGLSSMVQVAGIYLALRWWEELANNGGDGRLLLAWYLMCLSIGIHLGSFLAAPAILTLALLVNPRSVFNFKFMAWAAVLVLVGMSVHFYLMIRASHNPLINEGDPETWSAMMDLLQRKQYGSRPMLPRSAPWSFQFGMFWGYFMDQYRLWTATNALPAVVPLALGMYGAVLQAMREKKTFLTMLVMFGITSLGLLVYLNFTDHEVRDRDYFFTPAFHFFAIWIGMGLGFALELVKDMFAEPAKDKVSTPLAAACVLAVGLSWLPAKTYWFTHDRTGFYIARDFAYNMLDPLEKDAFIFTNGDNDTFPLWCIQAVDKVRTDIRVVNLSLLNTEWYIKQLRDEEPKVPMSVTNETLATIARQGYLFDDQGQPEAVSSWMVRNILAANQGAVEKPAYLAVTVPNRMRLDNRLSLEGVVYHIHDDTTAARVDIEATRRNLYDKFMYRGLFQKDGTFIDKPYKDTNAYRLTQNYAAAHLQMAFALRSAKRTSEALPELERILRMYPTFPGVKPALGMFYLEAGDTAASLAFFAKQAAASANDIEFIYYHAIALGITGDVDNAARRFEDAIRLQPDDSQSYYAEYSLYLEAGRRADAARVLGRWVQRHPEDERSQQLLRQLGGTESGIAPPGGPGGVGSGLP